MEKFKKYSFITLKYLLENWFKFALIIVLLMLNTTIIKSTKRIGSDLYDINHSLEYNLDNIQDAIIWK